VLQTSSSFSYRSAETLRPGSEPRSRPGRTDNVSVPAGKSYNKTLQTFSDHTFSQSEIIREYARNDSRGSQWRYDLLTDQSVITGTHVQTLQLKFRIYIKNKCDGAQEINWNIISPTIFAAAAPQKQF